MDIRTFAAAGTLALLAAACGRGDGDTIMGEGANPLTAEQVDAALGPETNGAATGAQVGTAQPAQVEEAVEDAQAVEPDRPGAPAPRTAPRPAPPPPTEEPESEADPAPPETSNAIGNEQ